MKKINPPYFDDNVELDTLSLNTRLGSHPELLANLGIIKNQYQNYLNHLGNPWSINTCALSDKLQKALKTHYESPPVNRLDFLDQYRRDLSPNICPMCGGFGTGTLDHYLPKDNYAEFSVFSKNLIPACSCNSLRGTVVKGDVTPKRVIHPYFDNFLDQQLYQAIFDGSYETPSISVVVIDPRHAQADILQFHLDSVILTNHIINWMEKAWGDLCRRPHDLLDVVLPDGNVNEGQLKSSIEKYLKAKNTEYETPNNWWSIFYCGLLNDACRLRMLADKINRLRV